MDITLYEEAQKHHNALVNYIRVNNKSSVLIGMELKILKENGLFKNLGKGGYDTWTQYLENAEIGFAIASAYNYMKLYEFFVEKHNFDIEELGQVKYTRLLDVREHCLEAPKDKVEEELENAKLLTKHDYVEKKIEEGRPPRPKVTWDTEKAKWIVKVDERTTEIEIIRTYETKEEIL